MAIAELLLRLARHPSHGSVVISKVELAQELQKVLVDDMEAESDEAALLERRPILDVVFKILRVT
jgi:hypothetical protein